MGPKRQNVHANVQQIEKFYKIFKIYQNFTVKVKVKVKVRVRVRVNVRGERPPPAGEAPRRRTVQKIAAEGRRQTGRRSAPKGPGTGGTDPPCRGGKQKNMPRCPRGGFR